MRYSNCQWVYDGEFLETLVPDAAYLIRGSRIFETTERDGTIYYDWPLHMARKEWPDYTACTAAFLYVVSDQSHIQGIAIDRAMLEASIGLGLIVKCFQGFTDANQASEGGSITDLSSPADLTKLQRLLTVYGYPIRSGPMTYEDIPSGWRTRCVVRIDNEMDVRRWARVMEVTGEDIRRAAASVGNSVYRISNFLGKSVD